jgi:hypothetical protein
MPRGSWNKKDRKMAIETIRKIVSSKERNSQAKLAASLRILAETDGESPLLTTCTNEALLAEVVKRGLQVPTVDLDAAEKTLEAQRDGQA